MLSRRQRELLNTDFGYEMEKQANEIVEMEKVAEDCYSYGEELALQKIAEMEEDAAEDKEDDEDDKEEEKTASAMGEIITDAYWNTLMEKGAEFYGDADIYIEKLAKDKKPSAKAMRKFDMAAHNKGFKAKVKPYAEGVGGTARRLLDRAKLRGGNLAHTIGQHKGKAALGGAAALGAGALAYRHMKKKNR